MEYLDQILENLSSFCAGKPLNIAQIPTNSYFSLLSRAKIKKFRQNLVFFSHFL